MTNPHGPLRVGVGGPVGSGKTALMDLLCKAMREHYDIAAITNDIYTKWDAEFLVRSGSLTPDRIAGVETGGCPHTAIREDASMNLAAVADMRAKFPDLDLVLIESGGDVDHIDSQIGELRGEGRSEVVATRLDQDQVEVREQPVHLGDRGKVDRSILAIAVCGQPPVSTPQTAKIVLFAPKEPNGRV